MRALSVIFPIMICHRGSEKISHMSEILGMDFFTYLDVGELPEHFAFLILKISQFGAKLWPFMCLKYP